MQYFKFDKMSVSASVFFSKHVNQVCFLVNVDIKDVRISLDFTWSIGMDVTLVTGR